MLKKYDKNGTEVNLLQNTDIAKAQIHGFGTVTELEGLLKKYEGYSLNAYNTISITIGDKTLGAWHRFYFPYASFGDSFGIITYPDSTIFYILGRTSYGFNIHQVY